MVDLAGQPHFFIEVAVGFAISGTVGLVIGEAILTGTDIAIGFFGLSLW